MLAEGYGRGLRLAWDPHVLDGTACTARRRALLTARRVEQALEQGQQIADTSRAAVEAAMEAVPVPFGVPKVTAAVMTLDSYPVSLGPVGSVDKVRLQRVVDVMQQFLKFGSFNINSMLLGSG